MEQPTIRRTIDLDMPVEQLWELISTADGWATWLVDAADVTIRPGGRGTVADEGTTKRVRIDETVSGQHVAFTWWDGDQTSAVQLAVRSLDDGRSQLSISEHQVTATAHASAMRWELRLLLLCAAALPALVRG